MYHTDSSPPDVYVQYLPTVQDETTQGEKDFPEVDLRVVVDKDDGRDGEERPEVTIVYEKPHGGHTVRDTIYEVHIIK